MSTVNGDPISPPGQTLPPREDWPRLLLATDRAELLTLATDLAARHRAKPRRVPEAGLAMLIGRDAVYRERFGLGEIPVSRAEVVLAQDVVGAACVMADDADLAEAVAVCDAVLAGQLDGWQDLAALLNRGAAELDRIASGRNRILARTRTDFALLNESQNEGNDA